ncbi:MAG: FG-GAP repeat domain-containing protein, partial [Saprospiraceae bacterium]
MKYLITICCLLLQNIVFGQYYQASVQENYQIQVEKINQPLTTARNTQEITEQIAGYPMGFRADPNTKNFRNVTLADINQDGVAEIIFAANNKLMAFSNQTLLWEITLIGTGIYPPSVADVDNDGDMEIVQVTGGNGKKGRVYLIDHEGSILSGFPKNYGDNWILTTAALADLDGDQQLEIIFLERNSPGGNIHIITNKGEVWSENWPVRLPGTPAVTPSIGDIDNDGAMEIVVASTTVLYAYNLDGQLVPGWPVDNPNTKFSFQSPILADLDGDQDLEIIGASH